MGMAEWTPEEKQKHMVASMNRKERRLYQKFLKQGMSETDAALRALGE